MVNSRVRLLNLLNEHKISQNEYDVLIRSLKETRPNIFVRVLKFLINPYSQTPLSFSLILGLLIIAALAFVGSQSSMNFSGFLGVDFVPKVQFGYLLILRHLLIIWVCISLLFFIISKLLGSHNLRILDFFAYCGIAKFPFLVVMLLDAIMYCINPNYINVEQSVESVFINFYNGILIVALVFWHISLYFFAFREASGLNHQRTWFGYVFAMVAANALLTIWLNPSMK